MELLEALTHTFDHAGAVIAGVRTDQFAAPTPCREWDVRALLSHTIGVVTNMGRGARGEALLAAVNTTALATDVATQFRSEADLTLDAWRARPPGDLVDIGAGPMPVQAGLTINLIDTATHSWDLARATGQREALPDDLAATVLALCEGFLTDELRAFAGFDAAIPVGGSATPTEQLVAFLGRQP